MKKLFAALLALCLILSLFPLNITAAGGMPECHIVDTVLSGGKYDVVSLSSGVTSKFTYTTPADGAAMLIFFGAECSNCSNVLKEISGSEWISDTKIQVIAIECFGNADKSAVKNFVSSAAGADWASLMRVYYGAQCSNLTNAYGELLQKNGFRLPLVLISAPEGSENIIRYNAEGFHYADYYRNALSTLVDTVEPYIPEKVNVIGTQNWNYVSDILESVNSERAANGLPRLAYDSEFGDYAMQRAAECALYYGHTRPDKSPCFLGRIGKGCSAFGENVAEGQENPKAVMESWMESTGHRQNILSSDFNCIGIGSFTSNGINYWVQVFGRKASGGSGGHGSTRLSKTVTIEAAKENILPVLSSAAEIELNIGEASAAPLYLYCHNANPQIYDWVKALTLPIVTDVKDESNRVIAKAEVSAETGAISFIGAAAGAGYAEIRAYEGEVSPQKVKITVIGGTSAPPAAVPGDYDGDGDVDIDDALLTLRAALGLITPTEQNIMNADMDGDGRLTVLDVLAILRKALRLI